MTGDLLKVNPSDTLFFVLISYTLGHVISFLSSITVEKYSIWTLDYSSNFLLGMDNPRFFKDRSTSEKVWHAIVGVAILPITAFDLILGKLCGLRPIFSGGLDQTLKSLISEKVSSLFYDANTAGPDQRHDFFRLVYHYCVENAPNHLPKMQNYVALYGFLRALALIAVIVFWMIVATGDLKSVDGLATLLSPPLRHSYFTWDS